MAMAGIVPNCFSPSRWMVKESEVSRCTMTVCIALCCVVLYCRVVYCSVA